MINFYSPPLLIILFVSIEKCYYGKVLRSWRCRPNYQTLFVDHNDMQYYYTVSRSTSGEAKHTNSHAMQIYNCLNIGVWAVFARGGGKPFAQKSIASCPNPQWKYS